jgi:riboflavin biosynthesis pyrimidine reductase
LREGTQRIAHRTAFVLGHEHDAAHRFGEHGRVAGGNHEWTPRRVQPRLAETIRDWRTSLGLAPQPATLVVTARGDLDPRQPGLCAPDVPVILAATPAGAERLERLPFASNVQIEAIGDERHVPAAAVAALCARLGARLALLEGGPHLFGEFLDAGLVDELFLTLAPQLLGRPDGLHRLGLVEGVALPDGRSRWASLAAIRRAGDHLFLRYRFS